MKQTATAAVPARTRPRDGPRYTAYLLIFLAAVAVFVLPGLVAAHWQIIGPAYVRLVARVARAITPSVAITVYGNWLLTNRVSLSVWPVCVGIDGMKIFSLLFAPFVLLNWKKIRGLLPLFTYLGSLGVLALAAFARVLFLLWRPQGTHLGLFHVATLFVIAAAGILVTKHSRRVPVQA